MTDSSAKIALPLLLLVLQSCVSLQPFPRSTAVYASLGTPFYIGGSEAQVERFCRRSLRELGFRTEKTYEPNGTVRVRSNYVIADRGNGGRYQLRQAIVIEYKKLRTAPQRWEVLVYVTTQGKGIYETTWRDVQGRAGVESTPLEQRVLDKLQEEEEQWR